MAQQRVIASLVVVLAFACSASAGFAQTQATTSSGTQTAGNEGQSAAAMAQEAANPFSSRWLLQIQQNNNWMDMPLDSGNRVQSRMPTLFQLQVQYDAVRPHAAGPKWNIQLPLFARTPSLPSCINEATALKPRVHPLGPDHPEAAIGLSERVEFHVGELDAPLA